MAKRQKRISVTQKIWLEAKERINKHENNITRKNYTLWFRYYLKFARENFNVRSLSDCADIKILQTYADKLLAEGKTASTIHSYISAVCSVCGVSFMHEIKKPKRHTAEYTKGREPKKRDYYNSKYEADDPRWKYLIDFQKKVGLRRRELFCLKGCDLLYDESGNLCVRVQKGKGGKMQLQRLCDGDEEEIRIYFHGLGKDEYVFPRELFRNALDLHRFRREAAKKFYNEQLFKINNEPGYADKLTAEVKLRWSTYNIDKKTGKPKPFDEKLITGVYVLRGKNKEYALEHGLPLYYNKLAVLATSIFKLSHWRLNVCLQSYLNVEKGCT